MSELTTPHDHGQALEHRQGLPGGGLRAPYQELGGKKLDELKTVLESYGVIEKYGVH